MCSRGKKRTEKKKKERKRTGRKNSHKQRNPRRAKKEKKGGGGGVGGGKGGRQKKKEPVCKRDIVMTLDSASHACCLFLMRRIRGGVLLQFYFKRKCISLTKASLKYSDIITIIIIVAAVTDIMIHVDVVVIFINIEHVCCRHRHHFTTGKVRNRFCLLYWSY